MVGIQAITQKIHEDAQLYADKKFGQIKSDIDGAIAKENERHKTDFEKRCSQLKIHHKHEYEIHKDILESRINHEILKFKHELVNEIAEEAVRKLRSISCEEFKALFSRSVKGLQGSFELELGEYSEGKLTDNVINMICNENNGLRIAFNSNLTPKKSGFLFRNSTVEYNCFFEDIVEDIKNRRLSEVLKEVFG